MSDDEELRLTKRLADVKAAKANKKKDPSTTAAEDLVKKYETEVEKARIALHFVKIGPVGDIGDELTKENARMVLKNLHNLENLLAGQNTAIQGAWFKDKKNADFIKQAEERCDSGKKKDHQVFEPSYQIYGN